MIFQNELVHWYAVHKRPLPWRAVNDAYIIWLSEVILQQTRVEQGLPYFHRFLEAFPTVAHFAAATEAEVLKLWQGLGYYSRGRNMLITAKEVMERHHGVFPSGYDDLIRLKGIGTYTGAAIAAFSSGEARAVLDGNVYRVLSRYFGIETPIDTPAGKKVFSQLADDLLEGQDPAIYNQAIMEFGALLCKPKNPDCPKCPVRSGCYALQHKMVAQLPVKQNKIKKRTRWFNYLLIRKNDQVLVNLRPAGDIWQGLYDLPLIETASDTYAMTGDLARAMQQDFGAAQLYPVQQVRHLLTHQTIFIQFFALTDYSPNFNMKENWKWVPLAELEKLPVPKVIHDFFENFVLTKK